MEISPRRAHQTDWLTSMIDIFLNVVEVPNRGKAKNKHKEKHNLIQGSNSSDVTKYLLGKVKELENRNKEIQKTCDPILKEYRVNKLEIDRIKKVLTSL